MSMKSRLYITALCLLVISTLFVEEVECRRKILRGRKTITRTYNKQSALPAWAIVTIVGVGMMLIAGALYFVMNKFYLGDLSEPKQSYSQKSKMLA